jgi:NagD protein
MDMDGVLVHEEVAVPGADRFLARLRELGRPFLVLTNNSIYTRRDLSARLRLTGLDVPEDALWTSALATARFLESQRPAGSAFVIGEAGLTTALHEAGLETILVLTGVTTRADAERFPYRSSRIVDSVADLIDELE